MRLSIFIGLVFLFSSCTSYPVLKQYDSNLETIGEKEIKFEDGGTAKLANKKEGTTTLLLVRHAEKKKGGNDPQLTAKGSNRAVKLAQILEAFDIQKVYSSNYQRTLETAEPVLKSKGIGVEIYNPRELDKLKSSILKEDIGNNVLVVGHSNSTPTLANLFAGKDLFEKFDESDYNNLLLLEFTKPEKVKATRLYIKM